MTAQAAYETDVIPTSDGDLAVTFLGHGSIILTWQGRCIHVDPYGEVADYGSLPKADLVLVTHDHYDHLDVAALAAIRTGATEVVVNEAGRRKLGAGVAMGNGDARTVGGLAIEAVPAYNVVHKRDNGQPFHPKGVGNGYVVTFGDTRVYIAGDTENIPEMNDLRDIDVAFLPANLPYTMTPAMVAEAARWIRPRILYPYHQGDTDLGEIVRLLEDDPDIEVRIRRMP